MGFKQFLMGMLKAVGLAFIGVLMVIGAIVSYVFAVKPGIAHWLTITLTILALILLAVGGIIVLYAVKMRDKLMA